MHPNYLFKALEAQRQAVNATVECLDFDPSDYECIPDIIKHMYNIACELAYLYDNILRNESAANEMERQAAKLANYIDENK